MWAHERHNRIVALLNERQRLTTEMFAAELGVSKETIRRDLIELELSGKLSRVHGGAIPSTAPVEASYVERGKLNRKEKHDIARAVMPLLESGMSCFIDAGSTTHMLSPGLLQRTGLRIVTNSAVLAQDLASNPGIDAFLLGGRMAKEMPATYGDQTIAEINRHRLDVAIVSCVGFDAADGAMDYLWHEAVVARAMFEHAKTRILLADSSKLGRSSRVQICTASEVDILVSDASIGKSEMAKLTEAGVKRIVVAPAA